MLLIRKGPTVTALAPRGFHEVGEVEAARSRVAQGPRRSAPFR